MATYEFTAFSEADLLQAGDCNLGNGDTFTMPGSASVTFSVSDNDQYLSGDSRKNENADDGCGQNADITDAAGNEIGNGRQIYAESYHWVYDQDGNWYVMIEIEQEKSGNDYYAFYEGSGYTIPPAGAQLTVHSQCNVTCDWIKFDDLGAGSAAPANGCITGRFTIDADGNDNEWNDDTGSWDEGVEGAVVQLLDLNGNVVAEAITDSYGSYTFDVPPGEYRVKFPPQEGSEFSAQNSGVAEHYDSDADASGLTGVISVASNQSTSNVDAGVKPLPVAQIEAVADVITVQETEGAGDVDINVLANDVIVPGTGTKVLQVEGQTANVGEWIDLADGGRVRINENGDLDFDADGDFDELNTGETATLSLEYTIAEIEGSPAEYQCLFFNEFARGTVMNDQLSYAGVTISSANSNKPVMIFDTANPTGGDYDLATNNLGKVLIISEDRDSNDPDDNAGGGTFIFDYDRPANVTSLTFLDTEEPGATIRFYAENGNLITTIQGPVTADGGQAVANFDVAGVARMEVQLQGSGAIDNLIYSLEGTETIVAQDTATVTINVEGIGVANAAPVAEDDAFTTDEETAVSGYLLANDSDPDGDSLTIAAVSFGAVGVVATVASANGLEGELIVNSDGSYTFTPGAGFDALPVGAVETVSFSYTITDGNGETDTANVTITINGLNEGPVAEDDTGVTDEDTAVSGDLLANDSDENGDTLTVSAVSFGVVGVAATVASANGIEGQLIVNADGTYTFSPGAGFDALPGGAVETVSFSYTISDGNGGTDTADVVITVNGLNEAPIAAPDAITITEDDRISTGPLPDGAPGVLFQYNVLANDSDANGDVISISSVFGSDAAAGVSAGTPISVTSAGGVAVNVTIAANGQVTFLTDGKFDSLAVGQSDTVTVNYTINDGQGGSSTTALVITIDGVNEPPQGRGDNITIAEDGQIGPNEAITLNVLANDTDANGDPLSVVSVLTVNGQPTDTPFTVVTDNGVSVQATVSSNGDLSFDTAGLFDDLNDGEADFVAFSYVLTDGNGGFDTASVNIEITGSGQPNGPQESLNIVFTVDASAENTGAGTAANFFANIAGNSDIDGDGNAASLLDAQLYSIQAISDQYAAAGITDGEISIVASGNGAQLLADPVTGSTVFSVGDDLVSAFNTIDFSGYTGTAQLDTALTTAFGAINDLAANDTANGESRLIVMTDDTLNFSTGSFGLFTLGTTVSSLVSTLNTPLDTDVLIFDSTAGNASLLSGFVEVNAGGDGTADQIVTSNDLDTFLGTISDDLIA